MIVFLLRFVIKLLFVFVVLGMVIVLVLLMYIFFIGIFSIVVVI